MKYKLFGRAKAGVGQIRLFDQDFVQLLASKFAGYRSQSVPEMKIFDVILRKLVITNECE